MHAVMIGRTLGHYRITAVIGIGGMGQVYRATDMKLGRDIALKVPPPETSSDPARLERFRREARALAALDHPGIVSLFSAEATVDETRTRPVFFEPGAPHFSELSF